MNTSFNKEKDIQYRLTRIETKLVRGFEELGVNIDQDREWLSVHTGTFTNCSTK
jgi:hypothetical protein